MTEIFLYILDWPKRKQAVLPVVFLFLAFTGFAQTVFPVKFATQANVKVYEVDFETQADLKIFRVNFQNQATDCSGIWFYTDFVNQAHWKIFFTNFETQADLKIFYVKFRNQAGWRNEEKKLLYCN
ncbi:DUF6150 family protein [Gillisia limnaea]|uniref:Secreted protein n=1 Tax=Gillisia limnaea (strain DSM 15749 / LMG 21470 / R-8282) TaxID=865937 RepID=H2BXJ7_GILLR|nr:DUF6150 family protein [Gillisia limnaea]EHQ03121.1 secreted protein [Gillisia limnaea DSM 15749]